MMACNEGVQWEYRMMIYKEDAY